MLALFPTTSSLYDAAFDVPRALTSRRSHSMDPLDLLWDGSLLTRRPSSLLSHGTALQPLVKETADGYSCQFPTPGAKKNQLSLSVKGERTIELSVLPEDKLSEANDQHTTDATATSPRAGARSFAAVTLPRDADLSNLSTSYADGMLCVTAPKRADGVDAALSIETDSGEIAVLTAEVGAKRARVDELEAQLREERGALDTAAQRLRTARAEAARALAIRRRVLTIA